jgi:hypothetical protein
MAKTLSASDERRLLSGVQDAVHLVDDEGYEPNKALAKVAKELRLTPGMLKTACYAYNTGRQLAQWRANDDVRDKTASFPLVDYDTVSAEVFGEQKKEAAYIPPLSVPLRKYARDIYPLVKQEVKAEKVAEERSSIPVFKTAKSAYDNTRKEVDRLRTEKFAAEQKLQAKLDGIVSYFRKSAYDRQPFAQIEMFTRLRHPQEGTALFDMLGEFFPKEKRASAYPLTWEKFAETVDYTKEPYASIDQAISLLGSVKTAQTAHAEAAKLVEAAATSIIGEPADTTQYHDTLLGPVPIDGTQPQKQASFGISDLLSFMAGQRMSNTLANDYPRKQQQIAEKVVEFDDPSHLNELRKIRAQTALSQLMSDPDDPISEADPGRVLEAYNSLVHMAPRLADQPEALGPLLRKRIVGNQEPFEAAEVLKFEEGLRKTQPTLPSANILSSSAGAPGALQLPH